MVHLITSHPTPHTFSLVSSGVLRACSMPCRVCGSEEKRFLSLAMKALAQTVQALSCSCARGSHVIII